MKIQPIQKELLALINEAREKGWALADLAEHLGCSLATISRWDHKLIRPYRTSAVRMVPILKGLLK